MTSKTKVKASGIQSKPLYKRRETKKGAVLRKGTNSVTLDDLVHNQIGPDGDVTKRNSFFVFRLKAAEKEENSNPDVCRSCKKRALVYHEREGMVVCSTCGVVQEEGRVVGAFSDNTRMIHTSEVVGDMVHIEFGYSDAVRAAVAKHEFTSHLSDLAHERFAHLCLLHINKLWSVLISREMKGTAAFLITTGAQFVQENRCNPRSDRCVDIILRYLMKGEIVDHMYTKFLIDGLKNERLAWEETASM